MTPHHAAAPGLTKHTRSVVIAILLAAFCSMIYELVFAHLLSIFIGHTVLQYSLVIGIYVVFLGIGALFSPEELRGVDLWAYFIKLELTLITSAFIGYIFCFLTVAIADHYFLNSYHFLVQLLFIPVVVVGFLSGKELPLLFQIYEESIDAESEGVVLFWDYLASFVATVVFPLLLLPWSGVFYTLLVAMFLNCFAAAVIYNIHSATLSPSYKNIIVLASIMIVLLGMYSEDVQSKLIEWVF